MIDTLQLVNNPKLNTPEKQALVHCLVMAFADVFQHGTRPLRMTNAVKAKMELKPDAKSVHARPYRCGAEDKLFLLD